MKIGDHVHIGNGTIVEAATIGNHVEIGKNCIIVRLRSFLMTADMDELPQGKFTIIKDCAKIADNTVIPPNTVVPALALFAGSPGACIGTGMSFSVPLTDRHSGRFVEDLPESTQEMVEAHTKGFYTRFQPATAER